MQAATIHGKFEALHNSAVFEQFGPGPLASEFANGLWQWGLDSKPYVAGSREVPSPPTPAPWPVQVADPADATGLVAFAGPLYLVHDAVAWVHPELVTGELPPGPLNPFHLARLAALGVWLSDTARWDRSFADTVPIGQARKYRARADTADELAVRVQAALDSAGDGWADRLPDPAPTTTAPRRRTTWH